MSTSLVEIARAKINLTLHVGRTIADQQDRFFGYHPLDSLVVFADVGDKITVKEAGSTQLQLEGPFGSELSISDDNLILRAIHAVSERARVPSVEIALSKNLPIASGIGGGSADAAAMLRVLTRYVDLPEAVWREIAISLGADVLVCYVSRTSHMTGIGEVVSPLAGLGTQPGVLVNPGIGVSTADIFRAFDSGRVVETPRPQMPSGTLLRRALGGRNDLQAPAIAQAAIIQDVLDLIAAQNGQQMARMSGSGASCFGLFETIEEAKHAAHSIQGAQPDWWCVPTVFGEID